MTDDSAKMFAAVHKAGCILDLVVKDSFKTIPETVKALEKCSSFVSFFHHRTKVTEKF